MEKLVSVIVPVYNGEATIKMCLDSILNQTYHNIELIVVNDGSTDKTEQIINKYQDVRLKYIKKENSGIGETRNRGLDLAKGEYIFFVDADDYLVKNCLKILVDKAVKTKADLVIYNYYLVTNDGNLKITLPSFCEGSLKDNPDLIHEINLSPWNKLYHKSVVKNNRFVTDLKYEDAPFTIEAMLRSKKIVYQDSYLYCYVMQKTGETLSRDLRVLDILKICDIIKDKTKDYSYIDTTKLIVKILLPYLKNSRYIKNYQIRNNIIKEIYLYLDKTDRNWVKYLKDVEEDTKKRIILAHKLFLKSVSNIYALVK